jgi:hypothetical protein
VVTDVVHVCHVFPQAACGAPDVGAVRARETQALVALIHVRIQVGNALVTHRALAALPQVHHLDVPLHGHLELGAVLAVRAPEQCSAARVLNLNVLVQVLFEVCGVLTLLAAVRLLCIRVLELDVPRHAELVHCFVLALVAHMHGFSQCIFHTMQKKHTLKKKWR